MSHVFNGTFVNNSGTSLATIDIGDSGLSAYNSFVVGLWFNFSGQNWIGGTAYEDHLKWYFDATHLYIIDDSSTGFVGYPVKVLLIKVA